MAFGLFASQKTIKRNMQEVFMGKAKRYQYDYDQYEDGKGPKTMVEDILADPEFGQVTDLTIGSRRAKTSADNDQRLQVLVFHIPQNKIHAALDGQLLTDKGGALLLEKLPQFPNIQVLDVHYHYMSQDMVKKLNQLLCLCCRQTRNCQCLCTKPAF